MVRDSRVGGRVLGIWQEVLGVEEIDPDTSFFDVGGDSITVTLVVSRVRERLGVPLQMRALFDHPTLAAFAEVVEMLLLSKIEQENDETQLQAQLECAEERAVQVEQPVEGEGASQSGVSFSLFFFSGNAEENGGDRYRLVMEGAKYADQHGFEAVWTPERHFNVFGGLYPNPSVLGAAMAAVTDRIHIRGGSVQTPLHHPLRIAEEWSVVDNLSGGRVGLAFASGFLPPDFIIAPDRFADRKEIMFDTMDQVRALWRGGLYAGTDGAGLEKNVHFYPKPIQPELPVWVAATRRAETFVQAGERGANILTALITLSVDELAERIKDYREALTRNGFDPATKRVTIMLHTFVGADEEEVLDTIRAPFTKYLRSHLGALKPLAAQHGIDWNSNQFTADDKDTLIHFAFERYYRNSLMGTEAKCMEMVERLAAIGVDEMACLVDFGVAHDEMLHSLQALNRVREQVAMQQVST